MNLYYYYFFFFGMGEVRRCWNISTDNHESISRTDWRVTHHNREVADSRTWGIFIRDTAYFMVIQWSMSLCFIESQWNMYPVWKCLVRKRHEYVNLSIGNMITAWVDVVIDHEDIDGQLTKTLWSYDRLTNTYSLLHWQGSLSTWQQHSHLHERNRDQKLKK